jgi:predicted amidohydrolase
LPVTREASSSNNTRPTTVAAAIQMAGPWTDVAATRLRTVQLLRDAAGQGAMLAVLPELCTISYDFGTRRDVAGHAEPMNGPSVTAWHEVARETGMHIVAGFPERDGVRIFNSAALIGPSGLLGLYRKAHLHSIERDVFDRGDTEFTVWDTPLGHLGILICYDLRFPEAVRVLLLRGAEVLCVPTAWTDSDRTETSDGHGWCGPNYLAAGHAYGNRMWVLCADRAGDDGAVRMLGCSAIFTPSGMVAAGPGATAGDAVLTAKMSIAAPTTGSAAEDLVRDRRPDLYEPLTASTTIWEAPA